MADRDTVASLSQQRRGRTGVFTSAIADAQEERMEAIAICDLAIAACLRARLPMHALALLEIREKLVAENVRITELRQAA